MADLLIRGFSDEGAAKAYFTNRIVESGIVDGILIKPPMEGSFRKDGGSFEALGGSASLYFVISYPRGTGTQIDSGVAGESGSENEKEENEDESAQEE